MLAGGTERMKANKKSAARSDRCGDTSDREIIHSDVSLDTRFISLPLFHLSSGLCLYSAWACVCVVVFSLYTHTHTHTHINFPNLSQCNFFASSPAARAAYRRRGRGKGKKTTTRPGAQSYHSQQDVTPIYLSRSCSRAGARVSY